MLKLYDLIFTFFLLDRQFVECIIILPATLFKFSRDRFDRVLNRAKFFQTKLDRLTQEAKLELFGILFDNANKLLEEALERGMSLRVALLNQTCDIVHVSHTTHLIVE